MYAMNSMNGGYGNFGGYGNYGNYGGGHGAQPAVHRFPPAGHGFPEQQQTLQDSFTGGLNLNGGGIFGIGRNEGFGLDLNKNGRYDRGQDGVLVFDTNRDGKYDRKDVQSTNDMMKASTGNFDFNDDGKVSLAERLKGNALRQRFQQLDANRDGRLETNEISRGGGRVWVDGDRDGRLDRGETHSASNMPTGRFGGSERLDYVDPFNQTSQTSSNNVFGHGPFGGGGYPGCGCGGGFGYGSPGATFPGGGGGMMFPGGGGGMMMPMMSPMGQYGGGF